MLGISTDRKDAQKRARRARRMAGRFLDRGRHRAEALRDSLPPAEEVVHDLREQAQPMIDKARDRALEATGRKRSRGKKRYLLLAVLAVAAGIVAYVFFTRRDNEPAYLMPEPDEPDTAPASGPSSDGPAAEVPSEGGTSDWRAPAPEESREMAGTSSSPSASASPSAESGSGTAPAMGHHPSHPTAQPAGLQSAAPTPAPSAGVGSPRGEDAASRPAEPVTSTPRNEQPRPGQPRPEQRRAEQARAEQPAERSGSTGTSGPASVYEAWSGLGPASRAAWDLPRSAMPPAQQRGRE